MPSEREAAGVIRGASGQLATWTPPQLSGQYNGLQWLARLIGPVMDFLSGGAFGRGWDTANAQRLNFQREQFEMGRQRMLDMGNNVIMQHKQMLSEYQDIFEEYENHYFSKNPVENQRMAEQAIEDLATRNGDPGLIRLLHNGGMKGVNNFLSWQDAKMIDTWSGLAAMQQARTASKTKAGVKPGSAQDPDEWLKGGGAVGGGFADLPGPAGEEPEKISDTEDEDATDAETTEYDDQLQKDYPRLDKAGIKAAHDIATTGSVPGLTKQEGRQLHPEAYRMAASAAGAINHQLETIAAGKETTDEKLEAMGKVDKSVPGIVSQIADYSMDPKDLPQDVRQRFISLAQQVDPTYKPANYKDAHKFSDPNSTENKVNTRAADAMQSTINVLAATNRTTRAAGGEDAPIPKRVMQAWLAGHGSGDDEYDTLYNALRVWGQNVNQVTSLTGNPRVTLVHDMLAHLGPTASPRAIRQQVLQETQDVWSIVGNNQGQWERLGKKDLVPGMTAKVWKDFSAYLRSNPETGEMPADAPPELKNVGTKYENRSKRIKEGEDWRPPTLAQVHEMQDWLQRNADKINSDPAYRARADAYEKALGTTINLPMEVPGERRP